MFTPQLKIHQQPSSLPLSKINLIATNALVHFLTMIIPLLDASASNKGNAKLPIL